MLDPKGDNLEGEPKEPIEEPIGDASEEEKKPQEIHLHKTISSILGHQPFFKGKSLSGSGIGVSAVGCIRGVSEIGKVGLIFKILLILSIALILIFYGKSVKETSRRLEMEGKVTQALAEARALQASVDSLKEKAHASDEIKAELEKTKSSSLELDKNLQSISQEKTRLESALLEKEKEIEELNNQLMVSKKNKTITSERAYPSSSMSRISKEAQEELSLGNDTEKVGKILVVKATSNVAVINLGSKDGVEISAIFDIFTLDNTYLCRLVIDDVEDTVSIGRISPSEFSSKVRENYIVRLR